MNQVGVKRRQIEMFSYLIGLINIFIFGRMLGNNGIAYLVIALMVSSFLETITAGGVSDALGRILRARTAKGQHKNSRSIGKKVLMLQGGLGLVCSILLAAGAGLIANRMFLVPYSMLIMVILAPVLFLRTISAVLIGDFQGNGLELPAAVAALLRQILLMGFGFIFVKILGNYGEKVSNLLGDSAYTAMYGGVGVAVAILLTEVFVLVFLGVLTLGNKRSNAKQENEGMKQKTTLLSTAKMLYGSMGMMILIHLLELLPVLVGTLLYRNSVAQIGAFAEQYGMLVGKSVVIGGILVLLICIMLLSVAVKTANAFRKEEQRMAQVLFQSGFHMGMVSALFGTVFVAVMAEQLAGILGASNTKLVADMLRYGSVLLLGVGLYFYFSKIMQFISKKQVLLGCLGVMDILFVMVASILLNNTETGILSLIYAAIAAVSIGCLFLGFLCFKILNVGIDWLRVVVLPIGAACIIGLISMLLGRFMTPHLGNLVTVFVCLILSVLVYWAILLLFRTFQEQELKNIVGGRLILAAGQTLQVFKKEKKIE